jgi:hypothetical protein
MERSRLDSAHLFPTGYPKAPERTTLPKYIGENGLKIPRKNPGNMVDSVRPERNICVSGERND